MKDEHIKHMVDRFLGWRLPKPWNPDAGISYTPTHPAVDPPYGTNLFDATQADAMVRHMVEGLSDSVLHGDASGDALPAILGGPITKDRLKELIEQVVRERDAANGVQGEEWRYGDQEPLAGGAALEAMSLLLRVFSADESGPVRLGKSWDGKTIGGMPSEPSTFILEMIKRTKL